MAQRSTVHRVRIDLSDTDRQVYEQIEMSVARADSETAQRLVARLLAFCLCLQPKIRFTAGVGSGDEPDVWVVEPGGRVAMWIEVGLPDSARLLKAARHCDRVVLLSHGSRQRAWEAEHLPALQAAANVTVAAFDNRLLSKAAKLAGAPAAPAAGLELLVRLGDRIEAGQPCSTLHAETPGELEYAAGYLAEHPQAVVVDPQS